MDKLERFEIMYLEHLDEYHKPKRKTTEEIEEYDYPPPPPPRLEESPMQAEAEPLPPTVRERQLQILAALRAGGQ
jgi:hypothetical protein